MSRLPREEPFEAEEAQTFLDRGRPLLVSLHFVRAALHRRLLVCVLSPVLGLLAAGGFMYAFPPAHAAQASVVLTSDPSVDPTRAMATNVSLLKTETLAARTTTALGLAMTPEDFLGSLTVDAQASDLMNLTLTAPSDAEAVRRLNALTTVYLAFRGEQLSYQSKVYVDGLNDRIAKLRGDVRTVSSSIDRLSTEGQGSTSKASDLLAQRTSILSRIETLQQSVEDATLTSNSVILSSRVLDQPAAVPGRATRNLALGLASGLIGGTALGWGVVLFLAITSDRLRRRGDVASTLDVEVPISVGRITPVPRALRWLPPLQALDRRRRDQRARLARSLADEVLLPGRRSRLVVACLGNSRTVSPAVTDAAQLLTAQGQHVTAIDLTARGDRLLRGYLGTSAGSDGPTVLRPRGLAALADRPDDLLAVGLWDEGDDLQSPELSEVVLTLADLDPGVGASHLRAWSDRVVLVLTAGRTGVERLRTVGDQVRAAGLELRYGALLRTERTDDSSGTSVPTRVTLQLLEEQRGARPDGQGRGPVTAPLLIRARDLADAGPANLVTSPRLVWAALFLNVLAFSGLPTLVPIPGSVGQLVTQGALVAAVLLALLSNRGGVIRPNLFLALLTGLAVVALMVSIHNEFLLGSTFRASRLIAFVVVLWLLTPWWGRADFALLRAHLSCLRVVLVTVLVGAVLAPGSAFSYGGRLSGALWPIPPTQVAHYSAVLLGCTAVLWFGKQVRGRTALLTLVGAGAALVGAHTRTALLALAVGLAVAGASMFLGHARVRRATALMVAAVVTATTLFAPLVLSWLWRGQSLQEASQLTGRTKVWSSIAAMERPRLEELFGSGLSNKSFNGLPIDSNWLAVFLDQGLFGVAVDAALLLILVLLALTHQRGVRRALALFLVVYCLVASFTETGLGDASPYLLELVVAGSLLAAPDTRGTGS